MVYFGPLVRGGALSKGPLVVLNTICLTVRRTYIPETCGGEGLMLICGGEGLVLIWGGEGLVLKHILGRRGISVELEADVLWARK